MKKKILIPGRKNFPKMQTQSPVRKVTEVEDKRAGVQFTVT